MKLNRKLRLDSVFCDESESAFSHHPNTQGTKLKTQETKEGAMSWMLIIP